MISNLRNLLGRDLPNVSNICKTEVGLILAEHLCNAARDDAEYQDVRDALAGYIADWGTTPTTKQVLDAVGNAFHDARI